MGRLDGKVAVVTGAAKGLGRGMARRLGREGAAVVVSDIDEDAGQVTAGELAKDYGCTAVFRFADVGDEESARGLIRWTVEELGGIDVLINNAQAFNAPENVEDRDYEGFERALRTGMWASFWTMQEAFPHLKARGGGSIINISSISGYNGQEGQVAYNATKEAIRGLTRTAAREWAPFGVRVNCLSPCGLSESMKAFKDVNPEYYEERNRRIPMHYPGDPEMDIGGGALFLASEDSQYVTGITLDVDGGLHLAGVPGAPRFREDG